MSLNDKMSSIGSIILTFIHFTFILKFYRAKMSRKQKKCSDQESNATKDESESFHTLPSYKSQNNFDDTAIRVHHSTVNAIPVIEPKSEKYKPIPYIFRVSDDSNSATIKKMVRCPPFHVQLDHSIAVVWSLYASEEVDIPLGINQLHWAYSFLKNVKDKDSTYPRDITHCIESITDELIEQYADLADTIPSQKSSSSSFNPQANSTRNDENVEDEESKKNSNKSEKQDGKKSCTCGGGSSSVRFSDDDDSASGTSSEGGCMKKPNYPFSITYNDMRLHNYVLNQTPEKKKESVCNADDRVNSFLNNMRKDQLKKILAELDRLHSIEAYIGNTDKEFQPYLDERDQELKDIISRKFESCADDSCDGKPKEDKEKKSNSKSSVACSNNSKEQDDKEDKKNDKNKKDEEEEHDSDEEEKENNEGKEGTKK